MSENLNVEEKQQNEKHKKIKHKKLYFFSKDKQLIWTIMSFIVVFFIVISFLNIKGLTTIYSYTFGTFFGMFSIVFFSFLLLVAIQKIFKMKSTYSIGVFHFSLLRLLFVLLSLIMLGTAIYYAKNKPDDFGYENAFSLIFQKWYHDFKGNNVVLLPYKWTPGILFTLLYFITAFPGGKFGIVLSIIIPIILFILFFGCFFISNKRFSKMFNKKRNSHLNDKNKNLNKNLERVNFLDEDIATKETIMIDTEQINKTDETYIIDFDDNKDNEIVKEIPDLPDFSTQEFDIDYINGNNVETNNLKNIDKTNQEYTNKKELISTDLIINDLEPEVVDLKQEIENEKNLFNFEDKIIKSDKENNPKRFSLIKDEEELF